MFNDDSCVGEAVQAEDNRCKLINNSCTFLGAIGARVLGPRPVLKNPIELTPSFIENKAPIAPYFEPTVNVMCGPYSPKSATPKRSYLSPKASIPRSHKSPIQTINHTRTQDSLSKHI